MENLFKIEHTENEVIEVRNDIIKNVSDIKTKNSVCTIEKSFIEAIKKINRAYMMEYIVFGEYEKLINWAAATMIAAIKKQQQ